MFRVLGNWRAAAVVGTLAATMTIGCAGVRDHNEYERWLDYPPVVTDGAGGWNAVCSDDISLVVNGKDAAVAQLRDKPGVQIAYSDAARYCTRAPTLHEDQKLFLLRGVNSSIGGGSFTIQTAREGTWVWVRYGVLTSKPVVYIAQPVIVAMRVQPVHVYVTASAAE